MMKLYMCLSLMFALIVAGNAQCSFPMRKLAPLANVQACVTQIKTNPAVRKATIESVRNAMYLYAFRDIVQAPPESPLIHMSVSVSQRLRAIDEAPFNNDWPFHQAINNVFIDLHDPHTVYVKPSLCYSFYMLLGLTVSSRIDNSTGAQVIFVNGVAAPFTDPALNQYVGFNVVSIDGKDALSELSDFAISQMFISKDPATAFNAALQHGYVQRPASIYDFPANLNTTWVLSKPGSSQTVTVVLQWQAFPTSSLTITQAACSASNMRAHEDALIAKEKRTRKARMPEWRRTPLAVRNHVKKDIFGVADPPADITFVNITQDTMLLTITTFEPDDSDAFLQTLTDGINFATKNNITQLLIDTSGNGGGDICLGYTVIQQLLAEVHPVGKYDMLHSPLSSSLANGAAASASAGNSIWAPSLWNTLRNRPFNSSDWYWGMEGAKYFYQRGNQMSSYSSPMEIACPPPPPKIDSSIFKKAIVMTDGLCGSTCAVFVSHITAVNHVTSVTTGGLAATSKQMLWSFPGGLVYNLDSLIGDVNTLGMTKFPYVPAALPSGGRLTFALLEIYDWQATGADEWVTPLEFIYKSADHNLPNWCFDDSCRPALYKQVSQLFSTVQ